MSPSGACRRSRWPRSAAAAKAGKPRRAHRSANASPAQAVQTSAGGTHARREVSKPNSPPEGTKRKKKTSAFEKKRPQIFCLLWAGGGETKKAQIKNFLASFSKKRSAFF